MIESNEPKDGDFVTRVEKLVQLPEGMRLRCGEGSPGEVGRGASVWSGILEQAAGIVLTAVGAVFGRVAGRIA